MERCILVTALLVNLIVGHSCLAGLVDPSIYSWISTSPNGKFVFVGVSGHSQEEQIETLLADDFDGQRREQVLSTIRYVHDQYAATGMYANDGSHTPLWALDSWEGHGIASSDGEHLIVIGQGAYGNDSQRNIARIYDRNGLVRRIDDLDIVSLSELVVRNLFADGYLSFDDICLDASGTQLIIKTNFGDRVEFDLRNGRILKSDSLSHTFKTVTSSWQGQLCIVVVIASLALVVTLLVRICKKFGVAT